MPKPNLANLQPEAVPSMRVLRRRAQRLMRRGDTRKAVALLRENAAREPNGITYCWLADGLLKTGKREEALHALRQALYCFRHAPLRGRARTVARWILRLDPEDGAARKKVA